MNKERREFKSLGKGCYLPSCAIAFVGTYDKADKANIMAAAWVGIINSEPPMMYVSVRKGRHTFEGITKNNAFTLSIPDQDQAVEFDYTGLESGAKEDKFAKLEIEAQKGEFVHAPYIGQCPYIMELKLHSSIELGSHVAFIGEVLDAKIDKSYINDAGKVISEKIKPLVYDLFSREYKTLNEEAKGKSFSVGMVKKSEQVN